MAATGAAAAEADPEALVDALNAIFGKHEGMRAAHANGLCVKGTFKPSPDATQLSKAEQFAAGVERPVTGRFSMGGGNPEASNADKGNARGFAMHFDLGKGNTTDLVLISAPVFPAKTPEDFLTLLQTVATKDGDKIGAYFAAHPEGTRQKAWLNERPVPASYTSVTYYGVHAFTMTNAAGQKQAVKLKAVPAKGEAGLSDDEAKAKAPDFYAPELKDQLAKGPAEFNLAAVLGEPGDPLDDPTALWPDDKRKSVALGTISISALEPAATCDAGMFDPTNLADGVEGPKDDRVFAIRAPAYAVSLSRRAK
jgi:catalase